MWDTLDHAFLPINHHELKYRQFATKSMRQGEWMTEYLDELICRFRKARTDTFVWFLLEEVKNCPINGLPLEILGEVQGYCFSKYDDDKLAKNGREDHSLQQRGNGLYFK